MLWLSDEHSHDDAREDHSQSDPHQHAPSPECACILNNEADHGDG